MENEAKPLGGQDLSGMIGTLLSNPAALSMLSSLMGSMGGLAGGGHPPPSPPPPPCEDECEKPSAVLPPAPPPKPKDDRVRLLDALRPFLSSERCEMIDTLLKIFELMAVFRRRRS